MQFAVFHTHKRCQLLLARITIKIAILCNYSYPLVQDSFRLVPMLLALVPQQKIEQFTLSMLAYLEILAKNCGTNPA